MEEYTFEQWACKNLEGYTKGMKEYNRSIICDYKEITSLYGCPEIIYGSFSCSNNRLTSLEFGPKEVKGDFWCVSNQIASLRDAPKCDWISCGNNPIKEYNAQHYIKTVWSDIPEEKIDAYNLKHFPEYMY